VEYTRWLAKGKRGQERLDGWLARGGRRAAAGPEAGAPGGGRVGEGEEGKGVGRVGGRVSRVVEHRGPLVV